MLKKNKFDSVTLYNYGVTELQVSRDRHTIVLWIFSSRQEISRSLAAIILRELVKRSKTAR